MKERTKGIIKKIVAIFLAAGVLSGIGVGIAYAEKERKEYNEGIDTLSDKIIEQVTDDLSNDGKYQFDGDKVLVSSISSEFEKTSKLESPYRVKTKEGNYLTTYGMIQDAVDTETGKKSDIAFKTEYKLETTNVKKSAGLKELNDNFNEWFKLNEIEYADIDALNFGLHDSKSFEKFSNALGKLQKESYSEVTKTFDALVPVYSKAELVNKDGVNYAKLTLNSLEAFSEKESNALAGLAFAMLAYNSASQSENNSNYALPIAIAAGVGASELFATKNVEVQFFSQTFELQIPEDITDFSEESLRKLVVNAISNGEQVSCQLNYLSQNLKDNKFYTRLSDKIDEIQAE